MINSISNNNLQDALNKEVAVVDFSATWCGPCRMLAPVLEELSEEMSNVSFYNVDSDENPQLAAEYGVTSIPCLIVLNNGEVVDRTVGFQPKAAMKEWIESNC